MGAQWLAETSRGTRPPAHSPREPSPSGPRPSRRFEPNGPRRGVHMRLQCRLGVLQATPKSIEASRQGSCDGGPSGPPSPKRAADSSLGGGTRGPTSQARVGLWNAPSGARRSQARSPRWLSEPLRQHNTPKTTARAAAYGLLDTGMDEATAKRWCDAWELESAGRQLPKDGACSTIGESWIAEERASRRPGW